MELLQLMLCVGAATLSWALPPNERGNCGIPPRMENAQLLEDFDAESYGQGESVRYICRPGYSRFGHMKAICSHGVWVDVSRPRGPCQKRRCSNPGEIEYGTFEIINETEFVFGAILKYSCDPGYEMISKYNSIECTATDWSRSPPQCAARLCPPVMDESLRVFSTVMDDEYTSGQAITLACKDPRNKLNGPSQIYCTNNGTWNEEPPTCKAPCSVQAHRMKQHNVRARNGQTWNVSHSQVIQFECIPGYEISNPANLSISCNDGLITYPTCHRTDNVQTYIKATSKVLKMSPNKATKVTNVEKPKPKKKPCPPPPPIAFGEPFGALKDVYDSGSIVEFKCVSYYLRKGKAKIHCRNGVWDDPPTCLVPCTVDHDYAKGNNTMIKKKYLKHNENANFKCLSGFQPSDPNLLSVKCENGTLTYPKCVRKDESTVPPSVETGTHQGTVIQDLVPY